MSTEALYTWDQVYEAAYLTKQACARATGQVAARQIDRFVSPTQITHTALGTIPSDVETIEFLTEAEDKLKAMLLRGDSDAAAWLLEAAADYHDIEATKADACNDGGVYDNSIAYHGAWAERLRVAARTLKPL